MTEETIPVYDVEELSLEEALLALASEQEKDQTVYSQASERLMQVVA